MSTIKQIEDHIAVLERQLTEYREELAEAKKRTPELLVGRGFQREIPLHDNVDLVATARGDARWLAQKCINAGTGAACDSGEARIVHLLLELSSRLEKGS